MLARINSSSDRLAEMFMEALASVQFQDITRQQVEQVIDGIRRIEAHTQSVADIMRRGEDFARTDPVIKPLKGEFEALYSTYVMDQQREIHSRTLNDGRKPIAAGTAPAAPAKSSKIELF